MLRMKAPLSSETMVVSPCLLVLARTDVHEVDSLSACNFSKNQGAKHRNRIRRSSVKMPGDLSRGVKARHRSTLAQHFRFLIGGKTAKRVGDGADQGVCEIRRLRDGSGPVRFRRGLFGVRPPSLAQGGLQTRTPARRGGG